MQKLKLLALLLMVSIVVSCQQIDPELKGGLTKLSLKITDKSELRNICSETGYNSLIKWSDSLRDDQFLQQLSINLNQAKGVFNVTEQDSLIFLSLGESDIVVGATNGYLTLIRQDGTLEIVEFRGGK